MYTIVGLGNPGEKYEHTRHNVGWILLRDIATQHSLPPLTKSSHFASQLSEGTLHDVGVAILFPTTFMNNSGKAVGKYIKEKSSLNELVVVHDDIDLAFGEVKISFDRGAGGHNGTKSIIDMLGTKAFVRVRVGIAQKNIFGKLKRPTGEDLANFVLGTFKSGEAKSVTEISKKVDRALELILTKGKDTAMLEINGKE